MIDAWVMMGNEYSRRREFPRALVQEFPRWLLRSHFAEALKPAGSKPGALASAHAG